MLLSTAEVSPILLCETIPSHVAARVRFRWQLFMAVCGVVVQQHSCNV